MRLRLGLAVCTLGSALGCSLINSLDEVVPAGGAPGSGGAAAGGSDSGGSGPGGDAAGGSGGAAADPGMLLVGGDSDGGASWMVALAPGNGVVREQWDWLPAAIAYDPIGPVWIVFVAPGLPDGSVYMGVDGHVELLTYDPIGGTFTELPSRQMPTPVPWRASEVVPLRGVVAHMAMPVMTDPLQLALVTHSLSPAGAAPEATQSLQLEATQAIVGMIGHPASMADGGRLLVAYIDWTTLPTECTVVLRTATIGPGGGIVLDPSPSSLRDPNGNVVMYDCQAGQRRPLLFVDSALEFTGYVVLPAETNVSRTFRIEFPPTFTIKTAGQVNIPQGFDGMSDGDFAPCENVLLLGGAMPRGLAAVQWAAPPEQDFVMTGDVPGLVVWEPYNRYVFDIVTSPGSIQPYELKMDRNQPSLQEVAGWPAEGMNVPPGIRPRAAAARIPGPGDPSPCN